MENRSSVILDFAIYHRAIKNEFTHQSTCPGRLLSWQRKQQLQNGVVRALSSGGEGCAARHYRPPATAWSREEVGGDDTPTLGLRPGPPLSSRRPCSLWPEQKRAAGHCEPWLWTLPLPGGSEDLTDAGFTLQITMLQPRGSKRIQQHSL